MGTVAWLRRAILSSGEGCWQRTRPFPAAGSGRESAATLARYAFSAPSCRPLMYQRWEMAKMIRPGVIAMM